MTTNEIKTACEMQDTIRPIARPTDTMLFKLAYDDAYKPERAHTWDAGFDLFARSDGTIPAHGRRFFDTGVIISVPHGYYGKVSSKSGLMRYHGIITDGTIDCGYTGTVGITLVNTSDEDWQILRGDKLAQVVIIPCWCCELQETDTIEDTDRGSGGFGSTGR